MNAAPLDPKTAELAAWLLERRLALGLGQGEVSQRTSGGGLPARLTQPYLSRLERGERPLSALTPARQDALRRALEISAGGGTVCFSSVVFPTEGATWEPITRTHGAG